jgi:hypothetical protein
LDGGDDVLLEQGSAGCGLLDGGEPGELTYTTVVDRGGVPARVLDR